VNEEQMATNPVELATELTIAWLSNPNTRANANEIPDFLRTMHEAVTGLTGVQSSTAEQEAPEAEHVPAVSVRKSLASKNHIVSLIDGRPYKTLRRHLSKHGLTPDDYRRRYGLKPDYPMVAPAYAETRRDLANKIGLGRKRKQEGEGEQASQEQGGAQQAPNSKPRRGRRPRSS
jgi:predicted transcriptional regulator